MRLIETSIEKIQEKAKVWRANGKRWHFHMLLPGCVFNERQHKHAFVLENTSDGEAYVFYSDEPQTKVDHELMLLLHDAKEQADTASDAIQPVLRRAKELNKRQVLWHHHIFFPGCMYSQNKAKWVIVFEEPQTGKVTEIVYEDQPFGDFRQIELLFFDQDMFKG